MPVNSEAAGLRADGLRVAAFAWPPVTFPKLADSGRFRDLYDHTTANSSDQILEKLGYHVEVLYPFPRVSIETINLWEKLLIGKHSGRTVCRRPWLHLALHLRAANRLVHRRDCAPALCLDLTV